MTKSMYDEQIINAELAQRALLEQRDEAVRQQVDYQALSEQQRAQKREPPGPGGFDASIRQNEALLENLKAARETEIRAQPAPAETPQLPPEPAPAPLPPSTAEKVLTAIDRTVDFAIEQTAQAVFDKAFPGVSEGFIGGPGEQVIDHLKDHGKDMADYASGLAVQTIDQTIGDNRLADAHRQTAELDQKHKEDAAKLDQKLEYAKGVQEQRIADGLTRDPDAAREQMEKVAEAARAELAQRQAAEMAELARQLQQREQVHQMADPSRGFR